MKYCFNPLEALCVILRNTCVDVYNPGWVNFLIVKLLQQALEHRRKRGYVDANNLRDWRDGFFEEFFATVINREDLYGLGRLGVATNCRLTRADPTISHRRKVF